MAPVIWGLNLGEMRWSAFQSSNMFSRDYHLRRAKMIVYQIAMVLCVVSESVGTDALSHYVSQQNYIETVNPNSRVHNDDFVGIASYNIFVGIYVATIFGAAFFFDLFWPERQESIAVRRAWKICAILACLMALGDALALTVIVASHRATITGVNAATADDLYRQHSIPPLLYRKYARAIASAVVLWPGWVATVASTIIMFRSQAHDAQSGPKSAHTVVGEEEQRSGKQGTELSSASIPRSSDGPPRYEADAESNGPYNRDTPGNAPNASVPPGRIFPGDTAGIPMRPGMENGDPRFNGDVTEHAEHASRPINQGSSWTSSEDVQQPKKKKESPARQWFRDAFQDEFVHGWKGGHPRAGSARY